jgi:hypothetical protein
MERIPNNHISIFSRNAGDPQAPASGRFTSRTTTVEKAKKIAGRVTQATHFAGDTFRDLLATVQQEAKAFISETQDPAVLAYFAQMIENAKASDKFADVFADRSPAIQRIAVHAIQQSQTLTSLMSRKVSIQAVN